MIDEKDLKRLETKLDSIIRLLAIPQVQGLKLGEAADLLDRIGLDREAIAAVCGTTPESIRVTLFNFRKNQNTKGTKQGRNAQLE